MSAPCVAFAVAHVPSFLGIVPSGSWLAEISVPHELIKYDELNFELDNIDCWLERSLANILIRVFESNQDNIHTDTNGVDEYQLKHDFASQAVVDGSQDPYR